MMESRERNEGSSLVPGLPDGVLLSGLPDELVLTNVVTRLPWYTRPVCRAVSKTWKARIDASTKRPDLLVKSRQHLLPLLRGHFLLFTFDHHVFVTEDRHEPPEARRTGYHCIKWREKTYQVCRQWRKLPSLQRHFPPPNYIQIIASCGIVHVWSNRKHEGFVLKIDMAGGDWTWNKISVPYPFNNQAIPFNAKIYVPRVRIEGELEGTGENAVLVHDIVEEQSEVVKTWNQDILRVLSPETSGACVEGTKQELYSFVQDESSSKLEVLIYDACKDTWRTKDMIPMTEWRWWIEDVTLVNGDCFEPAPDGGINIVWKDSEGCVLSWFNSSSPDGWVYFDYDGFLDGKSMEYLQFTNGQLYGLFVENESDKEEETEETPDVDREKQQDPLLFKMTIMRGTMVVKTNKVHWEEVLELGCFDHQYYFNPAVVSPVQNYTLMA